MEWIELCICLNMQVIILLANTAHFVQPCDRLVYKLFQTIARRTRDSLLRIPFFHSHTMGFKLKLGTAGHASICNEILRKSLSEIGMWPMDF